MQLLLKYCNSAPTNLYSIYTVVPNIFGNHHAQPIRTQSLMGTDAIPSMAKLLLHKHANVPLFCVSIFGTLAKVIQLHTPNENSAATTNQNSEPLCNCL
jgi:hypothetical protein